MKMRAKRKSGFRQFMRGRKRYGVIGYVDAGEVAEFSVCFHPHGSPRSFIEVYQGTGKILISPRV